MSYNKLSELCFNDCIWDFTSRTVKAQEVCRKLDYFFTLNHGTSVVCVCIINVISEICLLFSVG
jgi:hypothetical protein